MPLIFRCNDDSVTRTLIGECYFRDLMDGQILDAARQGEESLSASLSAKEMSSALKERIANLEKKNEFGAAMESFADLFNDPPAEDHPQIQWFCIR